MSIHPTANIHPTAVLEGDIEIGPLTEVGALCHLLGPLRIGAEVRISPMCSIGSEAEHKIRPSVGLVIIGDRTIIRDGCVIHRGTGYRDTTIGADCYIMNQSYIAHDCLLADQVTLSAHTCLGGHVTLLEGANLGMSTVVHQFSTIGAYCMVGMATTVAKDIPPFCLAFGNPIAFRRFNVYQLKRLGIPEPDLQYQHGKVLYAAHQPQLTTFKEQFLAVSARRKLAEII